MSETRVFAVMTRSSSQDEAEPKAEDELKRWSTQGTVPVRLAREPSWPAPTRPPCSACVPHDARCIMYASLTYHATLTLI